MAYVAVKGGERAIRNAHSWLAEERRGDPAIPLVIPEINPEALRTHRGARFLVFGDNRDGRPAKGISRILIGRRLLAPRDHQPDVNAILHAIGGKRG